MDFNSFILSLLPPLGDDSVTGSRLAARGSSRSKPSKAGSGAGRHSSGLSQGIHGLYDPGIAESYRENRGETVGAIVFLICMAILAVIVLCMTVYCIYRFIIRPRRMKSKAKDLESGNKASEAEQEQPQAPVSA